MSIAVWEQDSSHSSLRADCLVPGLPTRFFFGTSGSVSDRLSVGIDQPRSHIHRKGGAAFPLSARGQGYLPHRLMRTADDGLQGKEEHDDGLLHFSLPGLLRGNHTLVVNLAMRTATLLYNEAGGEARIVTQYQFSPNGMRILLLLLQAYPDYCPYEALLASLFPLSLEAARQQLQEEWEVSIRPVRAAIASIVIGLRSFGLSVYSLRGLGYILKPL